MSVSNHSRSYGYHFNKPADTFETRVASILEDQLDPGQIGLVMDAIKRAQQPEEDTTHNVPVHTPSARMR